MQVMYYIPENATAAALPKGRASNTIRLGDKWFKNTQVGEILELRETGTERPLGRAAVVDREYMSFAEALNRRAIHNHVGLGRARGDAAIIVNNALKAAYGEDLRNDSFVSVITLLPLIESPVNPGE
jgi:hypothetical protein